MMMCALVRSRWRLLLPAYVACLVLVLSFILFEVLDVDGSDFPPPTRSLTASVATAEGVHQIKKLPFQPVASAAVATPHTLVDLEQPLRDTLQALQRSNHAAVVPHVVCLVAFARASLADPAA